MANRVPKPASLGDYPEHAAFIGEIVAMWNLIEDETIGLMPIFTGIAQEQADLFMGALPSSQAKLDMIHAAGKHMLKNGEKRKTLDSLFKSLSDRLKARNTYAHGVYAVNEKNQLCILRRKFQYPSDPKSILVIYLHTLRNEVEHSTKLLRRVTQFYAQLWADVPETLVKALRRTWLLLGFHHLTNRE